MLKGHEGNFLECVFWHDDPSYVNICNSIIKNGGDEIWNENDSAITINYSNIQGGWQGQGNIDTDPCFVDPGFWDANGTPDDIWDDFWVDGDYHLFRTSLCIDAADDVNVYTDIEGNFRPFDFPGVDNNGELPDFDIGAYEATAQQAMLRVLPRVINRRGRMRTVMAWVRLPQGITKDHIDPSHPLILYPDVPYANGIEATHQFVFPCRRRGKRTSIFAFFEKARLMDAIDANGRVQLQVLGHLRQPGRYFYSSDTVRIKPQR